MARPRTKTPKTVETLTHLEDTRKNIPTAEYRVRRRGGGQGADASAYERRNRDLDPQLVWRGKDEQDWSDLVVHAPPLYIQEKVHPEGPDRRPAAPDEGSAVRRATSRSTSSPTSTASPRASTRPILRARPELVEPHDPRRLAAGHGEPCRARGAPRQGAVHLHRPAVRDQVQQQLPVVDNEPRREGRERPTSRASLSKSRLFVILGATAFIAI